MLEVRSGFIVMFSLMHYALMSGQQPCRLDQKQHLV